jgi:hypothetical protein
VPKVLKLISSWGSPVVADIITGEGWGTDDGGPLTDRNAGWMTGEVYGRLDFLHPTEKPTLTTRSALTALRQHAHRRRPTAPTRITPGLGRCHPADQNRRRFS